MIPERKPVYVPHDRDFTADAVRHAIAAIENANQLVVSGLKDISKGLQTTPRRITSEPNGDLVEFMEYQGTIIFKRHTPTLSVDGKFYRNLTDIWHIRFSENGEPVSIEENGVPLNNPSKNESVNHKLVGAFDTQAKLQRYIKAYGISDPSEFI